MSSNEFDSKKKNGLGKISFYIISGIVGLFLAIILFATLMTRSSLQSPILFGHRFFCITTDGYVNSGDFVVAKTKSPTQISAGEKIIYQDGYDTFKNPIITTGRITWFETTDNESFFKVSDEEEPRPIDNVMGEIAFSIPMFGSFILFIKTPIGLICCVAIPLFLLLIFEIVNLIKLSKNQKEEEDLLVGDLPSYMRIGINEKSTDVFGEEVSTQDIFEKVNNDYLFEQQDEKLEMVKPKGPFTSLSYKKPDIVETEVKANSIYSTREFQLPDVPKEIVEEKEPLTEALAPLPETKTTDFSASINTDTTNNFTIEGIAVKVQSDAVKLSLGDDSKSRDISITVTRDYTNVVVESGEYEVNFALFKDDSDKEQKVIIQKKNKP